MRKSGFTITEIIIVVGVLLILLTIVFTSVRITNDSLRAKTHQEVHSMLMEASRLARYGVHDSDWGVYFQYDGLSGEAIRATLYAGENYASRDTQYDRFTAFDETVIFSDVSLSDISPWTGNGNEVTFETISGAAHNIGSISLTTGQKNTVITINEDGIPLIDYVD